MTETAMLPTWLDRGEEFPPPGRVRMSFDAVEEMLVKHPKFTDSATRSEVWDGLERYLTAFFRVEELCADLLGEANLVHYLWLGGSFVSNNLDPNNIDVTMVVDGAAREAVRGREGSGWLTTAFERGRILRDYRVSPLEVSYRPVASPFRSSLADPVEQNYFRERGAWDDWWQRCRAPGVDRCTP